MQAYTGLTAAPIFQPIVGPFYKGLAVTAYLHPQQFTRPATPAEVQKIIADYYAGEPSSTCCRSTWRATTDGGFFNVEASNDTNRVDLFVFGNDERMLLVARLDNLGKGASGAAVQAMNVHLGVEESLGLV
jgi:N-acetyl-gamma-glutamyl-phosphate reductase